MMTVLMDTTVFDNDKEIHWFQHLKSLFLSLKSESKLDLLLYICDPSTQEASLVYTTQEMHLTRKDFLKKNTAVPSCSLST